MTTILLTIHFIISVALVVAVLLQRSEGGALGMGGGPSGLMSGRAAGDMLTKATGMLGAAFFVMSILLTVVPNWGKGSIDSDIIGQQIESAPEVLDAEIPVEKPEPE